jgi:hypothetical protein
MEFYGKALGTVREGTSFAVRTVTTLVLVCVLASSVPFGINFIFHDASYGKRESVTLKCDSAANGLLTTAGKKEELESLDGFLYDSELNTKTLITYGDIPALAYIFDMTPAIYTTWGDLDSNPVSGLEADLENISENKTGDYPVVIIGKEAVCDLTDKTQPQYHKYKAIETFMDKNNYTKVYENGAYIVYNVE